LEKTKIILINFEIKIWRHYDDLNDIIINLLEEDADVYKWKKLLASGNDSLSFVDIDNLIRQTYITIEKPVLYKNTFIHKFFNNWHLFFHGNTHITNFNLMLDFMQVRSPQFSGYEKANKLLESKPKSFRGYYVQKAEKFDDRISPILEEDPEDFRFPALQNYYNLSLG